MSPVVVDGTDRCVVVSWLVGFFVWWLGWLGVFVFWLVVCLVRAVCCHGLSHSSRFRTKDVKPTLVSVNGHWTCSGD